VPINKTEVDRRLILFKATLKESGSKLTHQRLEIFRAIASSLEHPDAEAIFRTVQRRLPTVSLDTVYRTLWKLRDLGSIATLGPRHESVRFDANLEHHHHFVCVRCGLARDFMSAQLSALRVPAAVRRLGSAVAVRADVYGVCDRCARREAAGQKRKQFPSYKRRKTSQEKRI